MAAVWITEIKNFSKHKFILRQNDGTWHPIIAGRRYMHDEPIEVAPRHDGATELKCQYFFVGWTDFARTEIEGPNGRLRVMVGPTGSPSGNDFLRIFDERENEVESIEVGPRGSGAVASLDLHLNFDDEAVRWVIWNYNGVGANILDRADKAFNALGPLLFAKLLGL